MFHRKTKKNNNETEGEKDPTGQKKEWVEMDAPFMYKKLELQETKRKAGKLFALHFAQIHLSTYRFFWTRPIDEIKVILISHTNNKLIVSSSKDFLLRCFPPWKCTA